MYGSANGDQAEPAPLPKRNPLTPTTIELRNDCTEPVSIAYGKTLRPAESGRARVSPGSFRSPPREPDGSLMIWILDPRELVISSARATAESTRVVIEKSCTSIRVD